MSVTVIAQDPIQIDITGPAVGEVNSGTNLGAGSEVYKSKSGANLQFRTLVEGSNITLTQGTDTITIDSSGISPIDTVFGRTGDVVAAASDYDADQIDYDNTASSLTATDVQAAIDELENEIDSVIGSIPTGFDADQINFTPAGNIAAIEVQAAIEELDSEKAAASHTHAAADVTSGTFADARISESSVTQHEAALSITESQISDLSHTVEVNDLTAAVTWTNVPNANITEGSVTQHEAAIDHDALTNFVANEHIDHSAVSVNTGDGLSGDGDITATRTISLDFDTVAMVTAASGDLVLIKDATDSGVKTVDLVDLIGGGGASELSDLSDVNTSTPTNRNVLIADGVDFESRALVEADISDLGSYLTDVIGDTTPQLGGSLDMNGKSLTNAGGWPHVKVDGEFATIQIRDTQALGTAFMGVEFFGNTSTFLGTVAFNTAGTDRLVIDPTGAGTKSIEVLTSGIMRTALSGAAYEALVTSDAHIPNKLYVDNAISSGGGAGTLTDLTDVTVTAAAKGDILVYNGSAWVDLTVGSDDEVLTAASGEATGLLWQAISPEVLDSTFRITDDGDMTKEIAFQASGITTGTTRTITMPDADVDLADVNSALQNVVEDTTPQLGGSLDVNGQKIVSVSGGDIDLEPDGSGRVLLGNFIFNTSQIPGAVQDNFVLTYDDTAGTIELEAASGGATQLSELSDVNTSTATDRNVLVADGVDWESRALVEADISDLQSYLTDITGESIGSLSDITITGASKGDMLIYNGSAWVDLTVGSNDDVLTADSAEATGVKWAASAGGGGATGYLYTDTPAVDPVGTGAGTLVIGDGANGKDSVDSVVIGNGINNISFGVTDAVVIGSGAFVGNLDAVAIGHDAASGGARAVAVGHDAKGTGHNAVAIGFNSEAGTGTSHSAAIAIGEDSESNSTYTIAIGRASEASSSEAIALGRNATATGTNSMALGPFTDATQTGAIAIGDGVQATTANEVHIGSSNTVKFILRSDGTLSVSPTTNYETLVTDDDDIPNKKYVDDAGALTVTDVTSTTYTVLAADDMIVADDDTAAAEITLTLPAVSSSDGKKLFVKKIGSTANVVIDGASAETIDGATTATLTTQYESLTIVCDGTEWWIV